MKRIEKVHSKGDFGSYGHQSPWLEEDARKNILRTHTTSVSTKYLFEIAKNYRSCRLFSIDRVYRNETVDSTHLAEFNQIEGVVVGKGLTLGNLMSILSEFYERLGLKQIKFKPCYNPYTEPSMEVFAFHEGMQKWIEVGNSGIIRPEMLRPMGFEEDVRVIAWGLSLERPAMIKYGIDNIRELIGHKVDLSFIKNTPVFVLDQ